MNPSKVWDAKLDLVIFLAMCRQYGPAVWQAILYFLIGILKVLDYPSSTTYFLSILLPLLETISSSLLHFFFLTFMFNLAHNLQFLGRSLFSNVRKIQPSPVFF